MSISNYTYTQVGKDMISCMKVSNRSGCDRVKCRVSWLGINCICTRTSNFIRDGTTHGPTYGLMKLRSLTRPCSQFLSSEIAAIQQSEKPLDFEFQE